MNFDFLMPTQVVSGLDCIENNKKKLLDYGNICMIVTSGSAAKKSGALEDVLRVLQEQEIRFSIHDTVEQNPLLKDAYEAGQTAMRNDVQYIIGIGGGSALDAAKATAIYANNHFDDMEDIFDISLWENYPLPVIAVGTTAGTGSEVTQYSVMTTPSGMKKSISVQSIFPALSFCDAKYTASLPVPFTISTALDALSHSIEGYFSTSATESSDIFAVKAINTIYSTLKYITPSTSLEEVTFSQRENLYSASIFAGFTIAQTGTTYCHSLGYFLSEEHHIPHGVACAVFLPGYINRQVVKTPERAKILENQLGFSLANLSSLITSLLPEIAIKLSSNEISVLVDRYTESGNFAKTSPDGLAREEAITIMQKLFLA